LTDPALTIEHVLSDDLREWLISEPRFPVLAVNTPDGAPSQSVMWFMLDPDQPDTILMNTRLSRAKYRWMRDDPRASLCFEEKLEWVALRGRVALDEDRERSLEDIKTLARRYGDDPEEFNGQERVTIRLRVEKVIRHA
jgi:PPOX class probable F420-dependent enzyme